MPKTYEDLANLDRVVHEPRRLAILTALSSCAAADFTFLRQVIGATDGNLGGHLATLEKAGLIRSDKRFHGKIPHTSVSLTAAGRRAIDNHWNQLHALYREARSGKLLRRLKPELAR